jgi:hypothetical protein
MLSPVVPQRLTMYISTHRQADAEALGLEAGQVGPGQQASAMTHPQRVIPPPPDLSKLWSWLQERRAQSWITKNRYQAPG